MQQHRLASRLFLSALATLILLGVTYVFHFSEAGHRLELSAFEFLQNRLPTTAKERLPIVVVDIGKVPGGKDGFTPRAKLREIISALIKHRPAAIGIDVNFSPGPTGWKLDDDPKFFDYCLAVKEETGIPIYLAVYESQFEPPDGWLGLPQYKELAAASVVDPDDTRRIPVWIKSDTSSERLHTISAALAKSYSPSLPGPVNFLSGKLESLSDHEFGLVRAEDRMRFGMSLVNYRRHNDISKETLPNVSTTSIDEAGERFTGRMVLVADATNAQDSFVVAGHGQLPGCYVIASAAYTLAADPLFEFNFKWRLIFDLIFAALLISGIEIARRKFVTKIEGSRFHKARRSVTFLVASLVFLASLAAILFLHVVWFDFPAIIASTFLHTRIEHSISSWWSKSKSHGRSSKGKPHEDSDPLDSATSAVGRE